MTFPAVDTTASHNTADPQFVEAAGARFAFRRFGRSAAVPLVLLQHFRATWTTGIPR